MKILVATNHLEKVSGSETVTFEIASYFKSIPGTELTVFANWARHPMAKQFHSIGVPIVTDPSKIRPLSFDIVYFQHQVAGLFDYKQHDDDRPNSTIVFGRLSATGFMESSGWAHDEVLGDTILANCTATADGIRSKGCTLPINVFYNAAPSGFHQINHKNITDFPASVLVVTNHKEPTLLGATALLRNHTKIFHLGRSGDDVKPLTPAFLRNFDVVISIGKTVQYALSSQIPVFVYDHFGGPGYLNDSNFDLAEHRNFCGKCTPKKRPAEQIVEELMSGYSAACSFVRSKNEHVLKTYFLPTYLDNIINMAPSSNGMRRAKLKAMRNDIDREKILALYLRQTYIRTEKLERRYKRTIEKISLNDPTL